MRMRNKPWAGPELDACPFFLRHPAEQKGHWHEWFRTPGPIHLELGCGKGYFIAGLAPVHPEIRYIGIDLKDTVLAPGQARRGSCLRRASRGECGPHGLRHRAAAPDHG